MTGQSARWVMWGAENLASLRILARFERTPRGSATCAVIKRAKQRVWNLPWFAQDTFMSLRMCWEFGWGRLRGLPDVLVVAQGRPIIGRSSPHTHSSSHTLSLSRECIRRGLDCQWFGLFLNEKAGVWRKNHSERSAILPRPSYTLCPAVTGFSYI